MPYARAPSRSVTAASSDGARRASPGATIRDEAARHEGASYGTAALAAGTTRLAGAALRGHRRARGPPLGRLPPPDARAPVVQPAPGASGAAGGGRRAAPAPAPPWGGGGGARCWRRRPRARGGAR